MLSVLHSMANKCVAGAASSAAGVETGEHPLPLSLVQVSTTNSDDPADLPVTGTADSSPSKVRV